MVYGFSNTLGNFNTFFVETTHHEVKTIEEIRRPNFFDEGRFIGYPSNDTLFR